MLCYECQATERIFCCDGIRGSKEIYDLNFVQDNPCQHPIVILKDVRYQDMESLLNFMYHGEVQICQDDLTEFLRTAQTLQVKGLTDVPHISPPRSPTHSVTPPPLHIPEVRLSENPSDEPSSSDPAVTTKRLLGEEITAENSQENHHNHQQQQSHHHHHFNNNNHSQEAQSDGPEVVENDKEAGEHEAGGQQNHAGSASASEQEKRSNHASSSILIQALEQGRQSFEREREEGSNKQDSRHSNPSGNNYF